MQRKKAISEKEKNEVRQDARLANLEDRLAGIERAVNLSGHHLNENTNSISAIRDHITRLFKIVDSPEDAHSLIERQIAVLEQQTRIIYRVLYAALTALLGAIAVALVKLLFF